MKKLLIGSLLLILVFASGCDFVDISTESETESSQLVQEFGPKIYFTNNYLYLSGLKINPDKIEGKKLEELLEKEFNTTSLQIENKFGIKLSDKEVKIVILSEQGNKQLYEIQNSELYLAK